MIGSFLSATVDFSLLGQGYMVGLGWLGRFARVIIEGCGIIGLGIIVFTLVLKAITLPFDIYQRVKMRKQNLIMREMKEDLEKLQKQYANDKTMYSQKMMELYKKNGIGMFGACLPTLLSLVILIVAFQGFRTYSQFANLDLFVGMSDAYNAAVLEHGVVGPNYDDDLLKNYSEEEQQRWLFAKPYRLHREGVEDDEFVLPFEDGFTATENGIVYTMYKMTVQTENEGTMSETEVRYLQVRAEDPARYLYYYYSLETSEIVEEYVIDTARLLALPEAREGVDAILEADQNSEEPENISEDTACRRYAVKIGSTAAKEWYEANDPGFLWVKNVWYPDVSYNHPIPDYKTFMQQLNVKVTLSDGRKVSLSNILTEPSYNDLTSELSAERRAPNGYFILIILSIGSMILSQFISMRSQKEANQYQTVDGQGAVTQKMMLIIMPLIYAMFAFMYSAAFSIYMTMSSIIALAVTLLSNLFIDKIFKKKEEQKIKETYGHKYAWMQDDKKNKKSKKKTK